MIKELKKLIDSDKNEKAVDWCYARQEKGATKTEYKSIVEAYEILTKRKVAMAANNLGAMYHNGEFVEQDYKKAIKYYTIAANLGESYAFGNMGVAYLHGFQDYENAYKWFSKGAYLYDNPKCLFRLGDMYRDGNVVEQDEEKAMCLYRKALGELCYNEDHWDLELEPDILYRVGKLYLEGRKPDPLKAFEKLSESLAGYYKIKGKSNWADLGISRVRPLLQESLDILEGKKEICKKKNHSKTDNKKSKKRHPVKKD